MKATIATSILGLSLVGAVLFVNLDSSDSQISETSTPPPVQTAASDFHQHINLIISIDGQIQNLTHDRFKQLDPPVTSHLDHAHDQAGQVVHTYSAETTLEEFLNRLNMSVSTQCFIDDSDTEFCQTQNKTLKIYINDQEVNNAQYNLNDLDRVLIYLGPQDQQQIDKLLGQLDSNACQYSNNCPPTTPQPQ